MLQEKLLLAAKGFCMGAADVVPGVSGGTMAFILGIYRELIEAIKSFDRQWLLAVFRVDMQTVFKRPHFGFLLPLGTGVFLALMFFTRVISLPTLLRDYPEQVYGLFFGLIVGSIFVLLGSMNRLAFIEFVMILPGLVIGLLVFNLVPVQTPEASWFIFLSGSLAICAMILPGISGSFILLILNKYAYIFDAIGYFRFSVIIPFGLGALTGLLLFSRLLSHLLNKYYRVTILFIAGLLLASLYVIWPFQERVYGVIRGKNRLLSSTPVWPTQISDGFIYSVVLMVFGIVLVFSLTKLARQGKGF